MEIKDLRKKLRKRKDTKNEKLITFKDAKGEKHTRYAKLVKIFKNTDSKYKYKVRIAPGIFIYLKKF